MTITAEQLRQWAEALCRLDRAEPRLALAALGWGGAQTGSPSWVELAAPPAGATVAKLARRDGLVDFAYLELPEGSPMTKATLDSVLGAGRLLPAVAPMALFQVAYRVTVPGAGYACTVLPGFSQPPAPESSPMRVTLRRDRVP